MTDIVTSNHIDDVLGALPASTLIATSESARLVMARTGIFVIMPATIDVVACADRAHWLATETRDILATHLSWIPFVDAVVVCAGTPDANSQAATVVPLDLLSDLLCEGVKVIDPALLRKIRALLDGENLTRWSVEQQPEAATIDLCTPMAPAIEL